MCAPNASGILLDCDDTTGTPDVEADIHLAARHDVPVLISGAPSWSAAVVCAIKRQSRPASADVRVVNCHDQDALGALRELLQTTAAPGSAREAILLLQEVHALSSEQQFELARSLDWLHRNVRVFASSSTPLFERVREGRFSERLYYLLNIIHIVVPTPGRAEDA